METYAIDADGAWGFYHPMKVPTGWRMLGTIHSETDHSTGALGRSPAGLFAQINGSSVRLAHSYLASRNACLD